MAIIKITQGDKLKAQVMPAGWQSFEIVKIGEPQKSGTGKSFNMHSAFKVIDDEKYEGKELKITFNTNMDQPSVMGTMYLMPHFYIGHIAAATAGIDLSELPEDVDTDGLAGQKFDGKVEKIVEGGVVMNTISQFLPYGAGKEKEKEGSPF